MAKIDTTAQDTAKRRALGIARDSTLADQGRLGEESKTGYPEDAVKGESPIARQLREAKEKEKLFKYEDSERAGQDEKPPVA